MSVFYGSDTACVTDVGLIDLQVTGPSRLIGERLARLLGMPRGALALVNEPDGANRGWDIKQYLLAKLTPTTIVQGQQQVQNECLKDEEVQSVTATFAPVANGVLPIVITGVASTGPFAFTLNVSALTVTAVFSQ